MRDWVHSLIALRKFSKKIKERQRVAKKAIEKLKDFKIYLDEIIPEAKVCANCNTVLESDDLINEIFKRRGGTSIRTHNCRFCFSEEYF